MSVEFASTWWPLLVMAVDWLAVAKSWKRLEYVAKPAAMVALLAWLATQPVFPIAVSWFGLGVICSLAGDIFLLSEHNFLAGLVAFLLGHVAYIVGLNASGLLWPIEALLLIPMALIGGWLFWRIGSALQARGRGKLRLPVAIYTLVICLMVVSALAMLFRPEAARGPAVLVSLGAALFFVSDAVLAWNRFVKPLPVGKLITIVAYHLGQMALIAGAVYLAPPRVII